MEPGTHTGWPWTLNPKGEILSKSRLNIVPNVLGTSTWSIKKLILLGTLFFSNHEYTLRY